MLGSASRIPGGTRQPHDVVSAVFTQVCGVLSVSSRSVALRRPRPAAPPSSTPRHYQDTQYATELVEHSADDRVGWRSRQTVKLA